jgi:uncharacterized protein YndB with AHSA1/START domain
VSRAASRVASRVQIVASVDVDRPPAEVFAYLADVARHGEWSPKPLRIEGATPGTPAATGTTFTSYGWIPGDGDHRNDVEVTRSEAPACLDLLSRDGETRFTNSFSVVARGTGSRVERVMELSRPGGVVGVVFPAIARFAIRPDMAKGLGMLRANLEGAARH